MKKGTSNKNRLMFLVVILILLSGCDTSQSGTKNTNSTTSTDTTVSSSTSDNKTKPVSDSTATTPLDTSPISIEEAWGDKVVKKEITGFSELYITNRNIIDENGYLPVHSKSERGFGLLNVNTNKFELIEVPEENYSYMFSTQKGKYYVYNKIHRVVHSLPVPLGILVYNSGTKKVIKLDIEKLQKAVGNRFIQYAVSIYNDEMYFEVTDRDPKVLQSDPDFGFSIYKYNFETEELKMVQDHGSSPTVTSEGMYFLDFGSDRKSGSLYFKKNTEEKAVELIKNCDQYYVYDGGILFTRGVDLQDIFLFVNGKEKHQFKETFDKNGWNYMTDGRIITFDLTTHPLYVFDSKLKKMVLISDKPGANCSLANKKYLLWEESLNPDRPKGEPVKQAVYYLDISKLHE